MTERGAVGHDEKKPLRQRLLGLASSFLERVVIPSARIPRDDSNAKVTLFLESANII